MKLTKDTLIEGKIVLKGTEVEMIGSKVKESFSNIGDSIEKQLDAYIGFGWEPEEVANALASGIRVGIDNAVRNSKLDSTVGFDGEYSKETFKDGLLYWMNYNFKK